MPLPVCFLNDEFLPLTQAQISPLDRGFLFADSVYEVIPVFAARPFRLRQHLERLDRSLASIRMAPFRTHTEWLEILARLIRDNSGGDQYIYLQVTRGYEFARNHAWPDGLRPTVFAYCSALEPIPAQWLSQGIAAITRDDLRWARRDIKSTALLANILAKKQATEANAFETIMLEDGYLTEGSSTSVLVIRDSTIYTAPNGHQILPGTTRDVVIELARQLNIRCIDATVTETQLRAADEVWLSFSTRGILPVTQLDRMAIGSGKPGILFETIYAAFSDYKTRLAGTPPL